MQRRKLIRRVIRSEGSRRWVEIELLPLGVRQCEILIPQALQFQADVIANFSEDELREIKQMLRELYGAFEGVAKVRSMELAPSSALQQESRGAGRAEWRS